MAMTILVNGAPVELADACSIEALLDQLGYRDRFVAVARNHEHVRRADFAQTVVDVGDEIDILAPMAGG
jgi:sulfur carrier protein